MIELMDSVTCWRTASSFSSSRLSMDSVILCSIPSSVLDVGGGASRLVSKRFSSRSLTASAIRAD